MSAKFLVVLVFLFTTNSIVISQNDDTLIVRTVSILTAQINFVDTVITGYSSNNNTRNLNHSSSPIQKLHYICNLTVKLNGDDFVIEEPLVVKCLFPNNNFQKVTLNEEAKLLSPDQFYYFNFDLYFDKKLTGWVTLQIDKDDIYEKDNMLIEQNIRYDKETLYIN